MVESEFFRLENPHKVISQDMRKLLRNSIRITHFWLKTQVNIDDHQLNIERNDGKARRLYQRIKSIRHNRKSHKRG